MPGKSLGPRHCHNPRVAALPPHPRLQLPLHLFQKPGGKGKVSFSLRPCMTEQITGTFIGRLLANKGPTSDQISTKHVQALAADARPPKQHRQSQVMACDGCQVSPGDWGPSLDAHGCQATAPQ